MTSADTGAGATVAVVDAYASSTQPADATRYFAAHDPSNPFANADYKQVLQQPFNDGDLCAASGWATEQAIDIEAVHAMAPDAHILYVGAQNCANGLFNADQYVIDNGLANVLTNSWGDTGGDLLDEPVVHMAYDDIFELAAATGITVQYSTGDDGDNFALLGVSAARLPGIEPVRHRRRRHLARDQRAGSARRRARLEHRPLVHVLREPGRLPRRVHGQHGGHLASGHFGRRQRWLHELLLPPAPLPGRDRAGVALGAELRRSSGRCRCASSRTSRSMPIRAPGS